jgi:single-strand DNA-binding protein
MSQGGYVTLVGFVAREPTLRFTTATQTPVADMRIGTTARLQDRDTGAWRDGETAYYTVNCWRRLAHHAKLSLRKGDPVVVKGRFRTRTYIDKQGQPRTEFEIVADTIGHDLSRGCATYMRQAPAREEVGDDPAGNEMAQGATDPDEPGDLGSVPDLDEPPQGGPGTGSGLDEDEVERFSQTLNDDGAMARELTEAGNEAEVGIEAEDGSEQPAGVALPF